MKKEEEKEQAELDAKNAAKRATMNEEQKKDFDIYVKEHAEKEAELKKETDHGLWIENPRPHECDLDPNSKSPLAGCRNKHPPKDNYQPYVGAAETDKVTKVEDTREHTKSTVRNIYQE